MKILKLHTDWTKSDERKKTNSYGGCGYYRTIKVAEALKDKHEVDVWGREWEDTFKEYGEINESFYEAIFSDYDMVWFHYIDNAKMFAWMYAASRKHGTKLVVDIDDNFLDVDEDNPAKREYDKNKMIKANLGAILSFSDAITVSTIPLKERLDAHLKEIHGVSKPIFVIPNYNDVSEWNFEHKKGDKGVVIGYMGSVSHHGDLKMVLPAIKTVLEKYSNVVFQLMGQYTMADAKKAFKDWSQEVRARMHLVPPSANQPDFPLWFSQQPWDIGIAPLVDTPFNQCKSHIKWMEYSMYQIPTVASKVYPYYMDVLGKATITDGETGLLARDDEWVEKLSLLIEDKELRKRLGKNAFDHVKQNWQYADAKEHIVGVVEQIRALK